MRNYSRRDWTLGGALVTRSIKRGLAPASNQRTVARNFGKTFFLVGFIACTLGAAAWIVVAPVTTIKTRYVKGWVLLPIAWTLCCAYIMFAFWREEVDSSSKSDDRDQ